MNCILHIRFSFNLLLFITDLFSARLHGLLDCGKKLLLMGLFMCNGWTPRSSIFFNVGIGSS